MTGRVPRQRAQSEPLAALIAAAVVCVAISVYAGYVTEILPEIGGERDVSEPAADSIWQDVSEQNVYTGAPVEQAVDPTSLPEGYHTAVEITVVAEDGSISTVGNATFDTTGSVSTVAPPEEAETVERPVSVQVQSGDVRPGRLRVEVWE